MSAESDKARAAAVRRERDEVKAFQKELRTMGVRVNFHEARNELQRQQQRENDVTDQLQKRLEEAKPEFMKDSHGLRGPQRVIDDVKIDGADGGNGVFQVKKPKGDRSEGINPGAQDRLIYFDDADVNGAAVSYYLRGREAL